LLGLLLLALRLLLLSLEPDLLRLQVRRLRLKIRRLRLQVRGLHLEVGRFLHERLLLLHDCGRLLGKRHGLSRKRPGLIGQVGLFRPQRLGAGDERSGLCPKALLLLDHALELPLKPILASLETSQLHLEPRALGSPRTAIEPGLDAPLLGTGARKPPHDRRAFLRQLRALACELLRLDANRLQLHSEARLLLL
jgi:hypothetical protein